MPQPRAVAGLFPAPKKIRLSKGSCPFGRDRGFRADLPKDPRLRETFARWEKARAARLGADTLKAGPRLSVALGERSCPREGFRLEISPRGVFIFSREEAGAFYALQALMQLVEANGEGPLPCLDIEDWPDLPQRGFMLDVSRCKVPTPAALAELVGQLAALRINTLQLYVEHTFAFKGAEVVWADASPLTPDDIQQVEAACRRHFITLTPNLNSFGHMERWLRHPQYKDLAESPGGFERPFGGGWSPWGSTLKPAPESLAFMDKLYADYLPRFASGDFNAGCDEPWELGQGASQARCAQEGKHKVYTDHVIALHALVSKYGKRMQFWGDILMEAPEQAARLPRDIVPVLWGYEAGHPLAAQAQKIAQAGLEFLVAPGTSAWLSFSGRWDNARPNIEQAARAALDNGASGLLLTSWGDNGNLQIWPNFFAPLALGAALAWNAAVAVDDAQLAHTVDRVFFDSVPGMGALLIAFGLCETELPKIHNRSRLYQAALAAPAQLSALQQALTPAAREAAFQRLHAVRAGLKALPITPAQAKAAQAARELAWGLDMNLWALDRLAAAPADTLYARLRVLVGQLEPLWLARARIGGLYEAQTPLRALLSEI